MDKVTVELGDRSYDIHIGSGISGGIGAALEGLGFSRKIALVSNPTVFGLYGEAVMSSLSAAGFEIEKIILPDGEEHKNLGSAEKIFTDMLRARLDRRSALIALGGGVIGDITGFAASAYMRGIDFIQIPTTLLAQVDSSVGGKTGVNHALGKNMIGTFWQPRLVWIDIDTLRTLPKREVLAGLAEVIKYGIIWDREFFDFLKKNRDAILNLEKGAITHIIKRSCEIKAEVVSKDERESGLRAILNFGHTIGHAIETATDYKAYLHGEAVSLGMIAETELAMLAGMIGSDETETVEELIEAFGLPSRVTIGFGTDHFLEAMKLDKKAVSGNLKFVLPETIGRVIIRSGFSEKDILKATESIFRTGGEQ